MKAALYEAHDALPRADFASPSSPSPRLQARVAGLLYLAIIVLGVWSEAFVRSSLVVSEDAAATAARIGAADGLFRLSVAADSVMALCDVALAILLFVLLRRSGPLLAAMATAFRLVQSAIIGMNLTNQLDALGMLQRAGSMSPREANALALQSMQTHGFGYDLGLIFFGVSSVLVGALLWRSGRLARAIGALMAAAGVVYVVGSYLSFLSPASATAFEPLYLVPLIAETAFCAWLLAGAGRPRA